jgi:hypothetical protein
MVISVHEVARYTKIHIRYNVLLLLFNGAPAHVGPRPPLMRFRNLTLIDTR